MEFRTGSFVREMEIEEALLAMASSTPPTQLVAAVYYGQDSDCARMWVLSPVDVEATRANDANLVRVIIDNELTFRKALGASLPKALANATQSRAIGDNMLPVFLENPGVKSLLEPMWARHRATLMGDRLPLAPADPEGPSPPRPTPRL